MSDFFEDPISIIHLDETDVHDLNWLPVNNDFTQKKVHCFVESEHKLYFMPGFDVKCEIVSIELSNFKKLLDTSKAISKSGITLRKKVLAAINPYLYRIKVEHAGFTWSIIRRHGEIKSLRDHIRRRITYMSIPIPTKKAAQIREDFYEEVNVKKLNHGYLPTFPQFFKDCDFEKRKEMLQEYITTVANYVSLRNDPEVASFFNVTYLSFIPSLGIKGSEEMILKCYGGRSVRRSCYDIFPIRWGRRWIVIKDNFVAYLQGNAKISEVMLMDKCFNVIHGKQLTKHENGIIIKNCKRHVLFTVSSVEIMINICESIKSAMETTGLDFIKINRNNSFAPLRQESYCRWLVDGNNYMHAVALALENAAEEIFIAGWWISPELQLKRPDETNYWQLKNILLRKAREGVKIFVLLFKEIYLALNNNSYYTKKILTSLHPNIQVLRHPDHLRRRVLLWSHHEKIVCIDQKVAFVGGVDLCFGRWDTKYHPIHDTTGNKLYKPEEIIQDRQKDSNRGRGIADTLHFGRTIRETKYKLFRTKSYMKLPTNMSALFNSRASRTSTEVTTADTVSTISGVVANAKRKKNNNNTNNNNNKLYLTNRFLKSARIKFVLNKSKTVTRKGNPPNTTNKLTSDWIDIKLLRTRNISNSLFFPSDLSDSSSFKGDETLFVGKDYVNWIVKDCKQLDKPHKDLVDRGEVPRMPWHDVGCCVYGLVARDIGRHFIQRWNAVKKVKKPRKDKYSFLLPKAYKHSEIHKSAIFGVYRTSCQVLRSVGKWSANIKHTENSILQAYIDLIRSAKHFIYIENQFFISSTESNSYIKNLIAKEILKRISCAHEKNIPFRVYIIIPLLPAFETEKESKRNSLYTILNYIYKSLFRGPKSLVSELVNLNINPDEYLFIGSLRNYGYLKRIKNACVVNEETEIANTLLREALFMDEIESEKLVTEQVYVHDKVIIVDDVKCIIGSANINDRSLLGNRDSEIAIYFKDEVLENDYFAGVRVKVGRFCSTLRKTLMKEHLGLTGVSPDDAYFDLTLLNDPVGNAFYKDVWFQQAKLNTDAFETVFPCIPSDNIRCFSELRDVIKVLDQTKLYNNCNQSKPMGPFLVDVNQRAAEDKLTEIKGHLILYPTNFLIDENLSPSIGSAERMIPIEIWI